MSTDSNTSVNSPGSPETHEAKAARAGKFGMWLFLASLTMLFGGSLIGYVVVRLRAETWRPENMPALPTGLWVSTVLLIACSIAIHRALVSVRRDKMPMLRLMLVVGLVLGVAFLINQVINWLAMINVELPPTSRNLFTFTFYMLTGLHAAHVIGGLIQLSVVTAKAYRGAYSSSYHPGITYSMMYWHFLEIVWLVMFFTMQVLS